MPSATRPLPASAMPSRKWPSALPAASVIRTAASRRAPSRSPRSSAERPARLRGAPVATLFAERSDRDRRRRRPVLDAHLLENLLEMLVNRARADVQYLADLPILLA